MRDVETCAEAAPPGGTPWARSDYELTIEHSPENQVYVARIDGEQIGHLDYKLVGAARRFALLSTKVGPQFQRHGVGTHLIGAVLDDIRTTGKTITIVCPVVRTFITRHPQYEDLIDPVHPGGVRENDPRLAADGSTRASSPRSLLRMSTVNRPRGVVHVPSGSGSSPSPST
jgi:predicted GNAT family acetyltransferase